MEHERIIRIFAHEKVRFDALTATIGAENKDINVITTCRFGRHEVRVAADGLSLVGFLNSYNMDKKDFMAQYRSKWWIETSKRIKSRDHNTCQMCGCNDKPLSVHHLYYGSNGSIEVPDDSLVTLCEECHESQKNYREECNDILGRIRCRLTDFEIYHIMQCVEDLFIPSVGIPIWMRKKTPKLDIPDEYADEEEIRMLNNLKNWRMPIYEKELIHDALFEYYACSIEKLSGIDDILAWFIVNFNISIEEYIEKHRDYASNIENEVRAHLENIKKKRNE